MNKYVHARYLAVIFLLLSILISIIITPSPRPYDMPNGLGYGKTQTLVLENGTEVTVELDYPTNLRWLDVLSNAAIIFIVMLSILIFLTRNKK